MWIHRYLLQAKQGSRSGALLRIEEEEVFGYADIHPWPERGDDRLERQIERLQRGEFSPLTQRSWECARRDAQARRTRCSLLTAEEYPEQHFLLPSLDCEVLHTIESARKRGFSLIKIKVRSETLPILLRCKGRVDREVRLRIDANGGLKEGDLEKIAETFGEQIDFVEDPFPFEIVRWKKWQDRLPFSLAADLSSLEAWREVGAARVIVGKPAVDDATLFEGSNERQRRVITSYLDHPVGQMHALSAALALPEKEVHGLASHHIYRPNIFSETLSMVGNRLLPPQGTGIGWDDLWDQLTWEKI